MKPQLICLTPVKNEAWILRQFLRAASIWADRILVLDQQSTDASREIALEFPKVRLLRNPSQEFNEPERQRLLIEAAREEPTPRILITLDADEFLAADAIGSEEWERALREPTGTIFELPRVDLWQTRRWCLHTGHFEWGFVDDGSPHHGRTIHSPRIPLPDGAPRFRFERTRVLHTQFLNLPRMRSKHRWYRCYERVTFPEKSVVEIERLYSWMDWGRPHVTPADPAWFAGYDARAIEIDCHEDVEDHWWDWEVLRMFQRHGTEPFRPLNIWELDWEALRQRGLERGVTGLPEWPISCPLRRRDRLALMLLSATRPRGAGRAANLASAWLLRCR